MVEALNHEPEITDVHFEDSKFVACGTPQVVCATAIDPDHDPLLFVWTLDPGAPPASGPSVISHTEDPDTGADAIAIRLRTVFSLGYDHRLVDGADAARFLARLKAVLQDFPEDA